jgi:general secretion pathway protein D
MKLTKMKISVLGIAAACLVLIFINGTVVSETETFTDSNQPAADIEPVVPIVVQPERPISEDAFGEMRPRRGTGGARPEGGQQRGGFGMQGFGGGDRFMRPGPVTVAGDPNAPMESLNLNNIEMRQIIQKLAEWTGKPVIPVNDEIMQMRVTIYSPKTVTRAEALSLLVMALQARGIIVEQLDNRVMLRPLSSIRLNSVPTLGPDEPLARIEDKTQIVEKWFRLSVYSPTRLIQIITPLIAEYGYAVADEGTARVGVIDTVENLLRIERIIQQLDLPESSQEFEKIIELRNADPAEVVQVLQLILADSQARATGVTQQAAGRGGFQQQQQQQQLGGRTGQQGIQQQSQQAGGRGGFQQQTGGRGGQQTGGQVRSASSVVVSGSVSSQVRMIPLVKQKWIIVRGTQEDIARIEEWAKRLDLEDAEEMKQSVVQVRYANVSEVARMVQNTLQQMPGTELKTNIVVEALTQTSQIVIYGNESNRAMVERLVAQIDLPKQDFFVERTFNLKHADPDQIKINIDQLYGDTSTSTTQQYARLQMSTTARNPEDVVKVIAYSMLKQVTVIASPQNMERIARQIEEQWDKPLDVEKDQYRIVSLNNSDPVKLADLLKTLFSQDSTSSGSTQNLLRMITGGTTQDSRQKIVGSLYGMLTFEPVPDTKKLIIISQIPEAYDVVERLIQKLDARDEADVPKVITLKYADPEALCDQLNAILNEPGTTATIQRSVRGLSAYSTGVSQAVSTSEQGSGTITPWWTRQRVDDTQMPTSNLIGRVRFVPVHRSKAVLVLAPPEYIKDITSMIEALDRPGMQVMIKAVIMEIGLSDMTSLGIQLSSNGSFASTLGPNALTALNTLIYRGPEVTSSGTTTSTTHFSSVTDANLDVLVDLLVKNANGRVLNQPTLWTKDNEEAIFVKGQKVAFITGTQTANTGSTQQSFTFEDVGVTLRIRPNITPEKAVDLIINLNISQIDSGSRENNQPVRSNLDTTSRLIINDGQSVMMGGILTQKDSLLVHKIPLLGDLPVLGGLFRHEAAESNNNELLVFVTPHVVDDTTLNSLPVQSNALEVIESARRRMETAAEALNQLYMQEQPILSEE